MDVVFTHFYKWSWRKRGKIRWNSSSRLVVHNVLCYFILTETRGKKSQRLEEDYSGRWVMFVCVCTFSLPRVSLRDCNLAVCSRSWALGVTAGQTKSRKEWRCFEDLNCGIKKWHWLLTALLLTWRFPSDIHHLHIGAHLQQSLKQLVGFAIEGAGEHFRTAVFGGQFGDVKGRQSSQLSAHLLSLTGGKKSQVLLLAWFTFKETCMCWLFKEFVQLLCIRSQRWVCTFSLLFSFFRCLMQSLWASICWVSRGESITWTPEPEPMPDIMLAERKKREYKLNTQFYSYTHPSSLLIQKSD